MTRLRDNSAITNLRVTGSLTVGDAAAVCPTDRRRNRELT